MSLLRLDKRRCVHTTEHLSAVKRGALLMRTTTQKGLQGVTLSEKARLKRPRAVGFHFRDILR